MVTGLDIVKAQIRVGEGGRLGVLEETGIPAQEAIRLDGHAMQCRITTEDPANQFLPDYGRISAYRGAFGLGVRVDGGTAYAGAVVTRYFDPLLEKVTCWAATPAEVATRMGRVLKEYRIRGVATNLPFRMRVIQHPRFLDGSYTTRFIDETPELLEGDARRDRASKLLAYIAEITVNGHPDVLGRERPKAHPRPRLPVFDGAPPDGTRQRLDRDGPEAFARWMRATQQVLVTDTTMRDAHQSLLATRVRTRDLIQIAPAYAHTLPGLLSIECWGGATFDVAMRFLQEDPWHRLALLREAVPNIATQMLLRGANAVGYRNYPDNVVRHFIRTAADAGIDLFRIFDCLNWVENMRVAIDAVAEAGKIAEGAICYTGDILDPARRKYSLSYYVELARELERAGCHVLAIKDMAGVLKPAAARALVTALREAVGLPIHLHTHDTSGISAATVLAAIDAGVDAVDAAADAMSGLTSQPCLGSIVEAVRGGRRDPGLDTGSIRTISSYWEAVRGDYAAFESDLKAGMSEVYLHEMPGGQFTNLREQARALGLAERWPEVARAYRTANDLFGDIVKVTPSSKVVGDMALMMVGQGLNPADVLDPGKPIAFPASVVEMLRGDLGQPPGGWPRALQAKVLGDEVPITTRPGASLAAIDLDSALDSLRARLPEADARALAAQLMYPKVHDSFVARAQQFGPVSALPTRVFFQGMAAGEEIAVDLEPGKTLVISLQAVGETEDDGSVRLFFELNGQPRVVRVLDRSREPNGGAARRADPAREHEVGAPMTGVVIAVEIKAGQQVRRGDVLVAIEAMKMEAVVPAPRDGVVATVHAAAGTAVETGTLLVELEN